MERIEFIGKGSLSLVNERNIVMINPSMIILFDRLKC